MNQASTTVVRRAGIVGAGTLVSRILGLVRESVIAAWFPSWAIDAYQLAFMVPNSFRRLTAEGAFSISLTSVFTKLWEQGDVNRSRRFVAAAYGFSLLFLLVLTLLGTFGARWITGVLGAGFADNLEKFELAVLLTRFMFPYILFISLTAVAMGLLNATGRFFAPAFAPVLLNVSIIGCAVGLSGSMPQLGFHPIFALAIGVVVGGVAQLLLQVPSLRSVGLLRRPTFELSNPGLQRVLRMTGPMIFGVAAYQIFNFVAVGYAATLEDGAVTYIAFAQRLFELPLAVLVMAISTAALPSLSALVGKGALDEAKKTWMSLLRLALFIAVPAMVALMVLATPIISVMYQRGHFSYSDTVATAGALKWLAAGLCSVAVLRQTVPFFYALEQVRVPVVMAFVMCGVYAVTAYFFKGIWGHLGLCMAISLAATVQGAGLLMALRRRVGRLELKSAAAAVFRMGLAAAPMGGAVYGVSQFGQFAALGGSSLWNVGVLLGCVATGVVVYLLFAWLLRIPEMGQILGVLSRKLPRRT